MPVTPKDIANQQDNVAHAKKEVAAAMRLLREQQKILKQLIQIQDRQK